MQLELKPVNKLTYKLKLTSQMRLAINLLQMPLVKLKDYVQRQVEENPLLEMDPVRNTKSLEREDKISNGVENTEAPLKETESDLSYNADEFDKDKQNYKENLITKSATLAEHLLNQLHLLANSDDERKIGEIIIANIDDNGYLKSSIEEIANSTQATPPGVEKVLSLVQTFDPIGVGARDLRECLLLQLKTKSEESSLVDQIVDKYLPFLEKKRYEHIAKKCKVSVEEIKKAMKEIANLDPKPGLAFNNERTNYLLPDAVVRKTNEEYEVIMNDWELPRITLNDKYKQMIEQKGTPEDARNYLRERLKAAQALIYAINQRKQTIQKVMEEIIYTQKDFLDNGETNFKPMTLEQIAKRIGKHKSTVSRTVTGKYLQTPYGIFELRSFLNSGIKQENGVFLSSKTIKSKIKDLIENENKEKPLSDQEIAILLKQEGISISRRTIAKYRNQLKILSSKSRRE